MHCGKCCKHSEQIPAFWLAIGDSNEDPMDSYIDSNLRNFQGQLVLNNEPSRWQGSLELDWIHTAQPARVTGLKFCDLHFSDHKIIECSVAMPRRDMTIGSLLDQA